MQPSAEASVAAEATPAEQTAPAAFKMETAAFSSGSASFIPKGKFVAQSKEEFPDFDALGDDKPKQKKGKKGKGKKAVVTSAANVDADEENAALAWKGKKSEFFVLKQSETPLNDQMNPLNYEMNDEQWTFLFKHYPEYSGPPNNLNLFISLFG